MAGIGSIEVRRLSLLIAGVSGKRGVVIQGTIVDSVNSLARFRLDERGIVWGEIFWIKEKGLTITRKSFIYAGGRTQARTADPRLVRPMLSPLSYPPVCPFGLSNSSGSCQGNFDD